MTDESLGEALDKNYKPFKLKAKRLLAKCIQHEYEHLQRTVILDKFTDTRKKLNEVAVS